MFAPDLGREFRWLAAGFLLMLCSGFGQTFFIALFAGVLKADLGLSDGGFGLLYTAGTLASAALLALTGKLADTVPVRWLGAAVLAGLAATSAAMALVTGPLGLAAVLFGLRYFGQGMCTHTAMTAMARWFNRKRGRAVALAGLGLPVSEGLMPPAAVLAMTFLGWRSTWLLAAAMLAVLALPVFIRTLRRERRPSHRAAETGGGNRPQRRHWTRAEVLRHPLFYGLMPAMLAPSFVITAVFFHQLRIGEEKGWTVGLFAAAFPVLALVHVAAALIAGWMIDRYGARRLVAVYLLALGAGTIGLALAEHDVMLFVVMSLFGFTLGFSAATNNALWAEIYGTAWLGAIRSVVSALVVLATAIAPGLVGLLLDAGIAPEPQLAAMGAGCLAASAWALMLVPRLDRLARRSPVTAGSRQR